MKKKQSIYILLPLVIIIWGIVIWKLFSDMKGDVIESVVVTENAVRVMSDRDTIKLVLSYDYVDPFLKESNEPKKVLGTNKTKRSAINRIVQWPMVEYRGIVKSRKKNTLTGMVKIDNKELLVREKQVKNNIKVFYIGADSIGMEYQKSKRYFKINGL